MSYTYGESPNNWVAGPNGRRWYWQVEFETGEDGEDIQRIFYWNAEKTKTGVMELRGSDTLHMSRLRQRILKLAKDRAYRARFTRPLQFLRSGRVAAE